MSLMYQSLVRNIWISQLWLNYVVVTSPRVSNNKSLFLILMLLACCSSGCREEWVQQDWETEVNWTELILHWPKQVMWSNMASGSKKRNVLQGWTAREGFGKGRTANILISLYLLQCIFGCSHFTRKSRGVFFEAYLFGGREGRFATCIFKHLDSVYWLS